MFLGTTPQIISQFLYSLIEKVSPSRAFVPFAGNFVVEQICASANPEIEVFSGDISLYSMGIGFGLTNQESSIKLKEEVYKDFPFLKGKTSPIEIAGQVIFFAEVGQCFSKSKVKYYQNLIEDSKRNVESYYSQIMKKLEKFVAPKKFHFFGIDAVELLKETKSGDYIFYDPPFFSGGYEKMFEGLEKFFDYEKPSYTEFTSELIQDQLKQFDEQGCILSYRTLNELEQVPKNYKLIYKYEYRYDTFYCIYSNWDRKKFVGMFSPLKDSQKHFKLIDESDIITENSKVEILRVKNEVSNHYRMMWVAKAKMLDAGYSFLYFIDGKLIGLVQLNAGLRFGTDLALINTDPSAPTSRYERLSKLILYLTCTKEVLKIFNDLTMWEHTGFSTSVVSEHPVSMKYRNLFKLKERVELKEDSVYPYKLIYQNRTKIFENMQESLKIWLKKEGKFITSGHNKKEEIN